MARGFESKQVEFQQEEAARGRSAPRPALTSEERARRDRRQALALSKTRMQNDLSRATAPAHRRMLEQALTAIDKELQALNASE